MIALGHRTIEPGTGHEAGRTLLAELYRAHVGGEMPSIRVNMTDNSRETVDIASSFLFISL